MKRMNARNAQTQSHCVQLERSVLRVALDARCFVMTQLVHPMESTVRYADAFFK
jgi:hypothetical protein